MPHVVVKLWPGKSEQQNQRLAERIAREVTEILNYGDESVSVAFEEIDSRDWKEQVYTPDIVDGADRLYKKPWIVPIPGTTKRQRLGKTSGQSPSN